ncbi:trigger factor [Sesbania bispinosa]|nr:trigger factor [Sesbania bispinosa]
MERENMRLRKLNERLMQKMNQVLAAQAQQHLQASLSQPPSGSSIDPRVLDLVVMP